MSLEDQVKPITYLKNRTADLVREVSESGRSVLITQKGEARVVVMDVKTYGRWREALALLKILALAEADVSSRRVLSQERAFARAEAALDRARSGE